MNNKMNYDIVIIDSGCNLIQAEFVEQISVIDSVSKYDLVGHGSSVVDIIHNIAPSAKLMMIKVTDHYNDISLKNIIAALEFVLKKINCKLINISLGLTLLNNANELEMIVKQIEAQNKVIISSFDNSGFISYPAAFSNVIGVDCDSRCKSMTEYIVVDNCIVDVLGSSSFFRSVDQNNKKTLVKGTSFATAAISGLVFNELDYYKKNNGNQMLVDKNAVLELLKKNALNLLRILPSKSQYHNAKRFVNSIQNAVVFPYNKEIHALANFEYLLDFTILNYYDHRLKGNINRKISEVTPFIENKKILMNIDDLKWNSKFDTIICGHCKEISKITGKDVLHELIIKCIEYNKQMYCFDSLSEYTPIIPDAKSQLFFYPHVCKDDVPYYTKGKLALSCKPIIGVYGTSSKQGKYTLQLLLRNYFKKLGYKVGEIGSEPSGYLFGFDFVFPYGYGSTVDVSDFDTVLTLNNSINEIEHANCDIIITGTQSNTVPYDAHYSSNLCFYTYDFLVGAIPDAVILCINSKDPIEYIERTIQFIHGLTNAKVIALSVYPEIELLKGCEQSNNFSEKFASLGIPAFQAGKEQIPNLASCIISYLS